MRDKFNTYAVLTDTAKTITVSHTWTAAQSFPGLTSTVGLTVSGGTAAVAALTATTGTFSGALSATTIGGTTHSASVRFLVSAVASVFGTGSIYRDSTYGLVIGGVSGSQSDLSFTDNGGTPRFEILNNSTVRFLTQMTVTNGIIVSGGTTAVAALTATTGSFSSTLAVTGAATFSSTINGQTISAAASFTGSVAVANGLTVAAGTTAVQALTCTTLAPSGITTLSGTGTTYALDFTGAAGRIRLSNNGSLTVVENDGSTAIMTITESTGGVAFAGAVTGVGATFSGEVRVGSTTALSASATSGFFWMPSMNGTPIGSPTETGDRVAVIYNYSANKVWFYNPTDNTWRGINAT